MAERSFLTSRHPGPVSFEWKDGGGGGQAETLGKLYTRLQKRHGVVTPELVVEESRPEDSPTHALFEWDDETAGELWRVHQARRYLGQLVIVRGDDKSRIVAVTTVIRGEPARGYLDLRKAAEDDLAMRRLASECYQSLKGWRERGATINRFKGVWEAFDELEPPE